jgi:hypothetical protein
MHMLRDEDNAKYRLAIKNTLEFDPQILKRYVNFMNNPDEKTAVEQFGNGDKYFGICTVLSTLPGLPMFGHGQIEGFYEKYGMEYRRAKWDESPDEGLIRGHEWRIFPLLHRRYLFADVEQFLLYDFYLPNGSVDENIFAYSNRFNDERGLVIYHNKFANTRGWIKNSAAYIDKTSGKIIRKNITDGLELPQVGYVIFKDYVTQLEYIRSCGEIWQKGMYIELGAYQCHAFMEWRFVIDVKWRTICDELNGAGVQSMQVEWNKLFTVLEEVKVKEELPVKKRIVRKAGTKAAKVKSKEIGVKKEKVTTTKPKKAKALVRKPKTKEVALNEKKSTAKKVVPAKAKPKKKVVIKTTVKKTDGAKKAVAKKTTPRDTGK